MTPHAFPEPEGWFTWLTELTASMAHFSKHLDTLSSRPVASQWGLQKAEIWKRGFSCKNSERFGGCPRTLRALNTLLSTFRYFYFPHTAAGPHYSTFSLH